VRLVAQKHQTSPPQNCVTSLPPRGRISTHHWGPEPRHNIESGPKFQMFCEKWPYLTVAREPFGDEMAAWSRQRTRGRQSTLQRRSRHRTVTFLPNGFDAVRAINSNLCVLVGPSAVVSLVKKRCLLPERRNQSRKTCKTMLEGITTADAPYTRVYSWKRFRTVGWSNLTCEVTNASHFEPPRTCGPGISIR
jgi:hypothetical protein